MKNSEKIYDVFISHASEDKESLVRPLAIALRSLGASVWYDEFSLRIGDSLSGSIDKGISNSRFGLVVISKNFMKKPWPDYELRGLVNRDVEEGRVILPIWHGVTKEQVREFSPPLSDKVALNTDGISAQDVALGVLREIRPDLYEKHPRSELEKIASGEALQGLQKEIERTRETLEQTKEELAEFQCPYCEAPLVARVHSPPSEKYGYMREDYQCGHVSIDGSTERPCPSDPKFPKWSDFELHYFESPDEPHLKWRCHAIGQTAMARGLNLFPGYGETKEEAEREVRESYDRYATRWKP